MTDPETRAAAVRALLKQAELPPQEVARRLEWALDPDYWRSLVPFALIDGPVQDDEVVRIAPDAAARETRRLAAEGYFHLGNVVESGRVGRLYRTIEAVRAAGWPAVLAFVFDDFWSLSKSGSLLDFLTASLGDNCLQNTVVWAHWVIGVTGNTGWHPHVDRQGEADRLLSVWTALSDATVDNGCMFLVRPRAVAPEMVQAIAGKADLPYPSYRGLLHNVVALPATAGSMIGWRGDVLH